MVFIEVLQQNVTLLTVCVGLLGLMVGSFLNVVIYRLPLMIQRNWKRECLDYLEQSSECESTEAFDLTRPGSHCPHCNHAISALENIPVLSYLALRGRCKACKAPISPRYPIIELVTALASSYVAWRFGFTVTTAMLLLLTWSLISLTMIDFDTQLLPDVITLPILWLGLCLSLVPGLVPPETAILGAALGYLSLWSVYWLFKLITGKEGMGHGDFKLLALLGAWLGWQMLPLVIFLSAIVGAFVGIALILIKGRDKNIPIPFGPYLATAGWIALMWGPQINQAYLATLGL